jgi:hypothetical protein
MDDVEASPVLLEVLQDEPAMAVLGCGLAAEQDRRHSEERGVKPLFDAACAHQGEELTLVVVPTAFLLPVGVQHGLFGRQQRLVDVLGVEQLAQEVGQVLALGEGSELRGVVEPHV